MMCEVKDSYWKIAFVVAALLSVTQHATGNIIVLPVTILGLFTEGA